MLLEATLRLVSTPTQQIQLSRNLWNNLSENNFPVTVAISLPTLSTVDLTDTVLDVLLPKIVALARPISTFIPVTEDYEVNFHQAETTLVIELGNGPQFNQHYLLSEHRFALLHIGGVEIQRVQVAELDEVILGAADAISYEFATNSPIALSQLFSRDPISSTEPLILRHGFRYQIPSPVDAADSYLDFTVMMCNPLLQGVISDRTNFVVTNFEKVDIDESWIEIDSIKGAEDCFINGVLPGDHGSESGPFSPQFLAIDSALSDSDAEISEEPSFHFSVPLLTDSDSDTEAPAQQPNGNTRPPPRTIRPVEFEPFVLAAPISVARLSPRPEEGEDELHRVFVGIYALSRLGIFSGDWVLVSGPDYRKSRICKAYGVEVQGAQKGPLLPAYLSPLLHFNLGFPVPPLISTALLTLTRLKSQPLIPHGAPLARAITCARVASPLSVDKQLQPAFLDALKRYFESGARIVCEGDLVAVGVDGAFRRKMEKEGGRLEDTARLKPQKNESDADAWEDISLPTTAPFPPSIVYFKITSVEADALSANGNTNGSSRHHPSYYGYGRCVDPAATKMVQTGLEHSRVPPGLGVGRWVTEKNGVSTISSMPPTPTNRAYYNDSYATLHDFVSSCLHPLSVSLELSCTVLLHGPRGVGKRTMIRWVVERCGVHLVEVNCYDFAGETDAKTEASLRGSRFPTEPVIATVLRDLFNDLLESHRRTGHPIMVVATTGDIERLPTSVLGCFRHEVQAPAEPTRLEILRNLTAPSPLAPDVSLRVLATQTAALVAKDLVDLVARAGLAALERVTAGIGTTNVTDIDIACAGVALTAADFDNALNKARASYSDSIGAPKIPNVTWDDVGGLAGVKNDILDTIQLPLENPELFASGMKKRSGILLYGPPGTGKTLLAKAIATSCSLNFFSVKGPELLNMYIGESEANVRRVFQRARDAKPCVIFFDELDSVAPKRGEKGDSGGVMDRIVSQLLAELDGMSEGKSATGGQTGEKGAALGGSADVFVIGATNRPDLLDPALLRPGRFDKLLYLGVSQDHDTQLKIIRALTRKFRLHPDLDLRHIAEKCPFNYTGADFYALCSDAMLKAMTRVAETVEAKVVYVAFPLLFRPYMSLNPHMTFEPQFAASLNAKSQSSDGIASYPVPLTSQYFLSHMAKPEDIAVEVTEEDFDRAQRELVPSVSESELDHYKKVRERFEGEMKDGRVEEGEEEDWGGMADWTGSDCSFCSSKLKALLCRRTCALYHFAAIAIRPLSRRSVRLAPAAELPPLPLMPSASFAFPSTTRRTTVQSTLDQHDSADDSSASTSSRTQPRRSRSRRTDTTTPSTDTADADPSSPRRSPHLNRGASNIDMLDGETSELMLRDLRKNREFMDDEDGEERGIGDVSKSEFGDNEKDYADNRNGSVGNANGHEHTSVSALSKKDLGNITLLVILCE
ncbi:P-loop containing nucleoside triphosphate hydrolase protein [Endogone sp. FLAS-F59071]|nr:P-loop containing nucleoside triphosphate hydrolase protein [Endogone sp. FLAS-F59071]|eukprot:RUS17939.1 P-loop containing nucleoside triphosphate hydrolase protein [Endogone sp. FLAS-F59071]